MKLTKFFAIGFSAMALAVTGCQVKAPYESISGVDSSKAKPTELTLDVDNTSATSISVYWDGAAAVEAGATTFTCQIVENIDDAGDTYNTATSKTIESTDDAGNVNDAATFTKLTSGALYYVRVRANYRYSVVSDWVYLERDGAIIQVSVGNGVVISEFVAPQDLEASALTYSSISARWAMIGPADAYEVSYKKSEDTEWTVAESNLTATSVVVKGLEQLTSYDIAVRAFRTVEGEKEYTDYTIYTAVVTPEKPAFDPDIKTAEQLKRFFEEIASVCADSDNYRIMNDIDMAGQEIIPGTNFLGTLDGQNFKIKNLNLNGLSLLDKNEGVIKNVVLDASCQFVAADTWGPLCRVNAGTVQSCVNNANVTVNDHSTKVLVGGLVGETSGLVKDCVNKGNVTFNGNATASHSCFAGVVGAAAGKAGDILVENCTNEGDVSLKNGATAKNNYVGGVVGGCYPSELKTALSTNVGTIKGCVNKGNISHEWSVNDSGSYCDVGGVVGYFEGNVEGCTNYGSVLVKTPMASNAATSTRPGIGGVIGCNIYSVIDCINEGTVTIEGAFAAGTQGNRGAGSTHQPVFGGVVGAVGGDAKFGPQAESDVLKGCVNKGKMTTNTIQKTGGGTQAYAGGVAGYSFLPVIDCRNEGELDWAHGTKTQRMGGIVGAAYKDITNCTNAGPLTFNAKGGTDYRDVTGYVAYQNYIGGIVGMLMVANLTIDGCENTADIKYLNGWKSDVLNYVGGFIGSYVDSGHTCKNSNNSGNIVVESEFGVSTCTGGCFGAFNGNIENVHNTGNVTLKTAGGQIAAKEHEVGGIAGYINGNIYSSSFKGTVLNDVAGTFAGGLIGGMGQCTREVKSCSVDGAVEGAATRGSLLGRFRYAGTYIFYWSAVTISGTASTLPVVGNLNGNTEQNAEMPAA